VSSFKLCSLIVPILTEPKMPFLFDFSPTLVANLWDVTDRDIDKFTQGVFDHLHLTPDEVRRSHKGRTVETSVVAAVAKSRHLCKLKYLTGAAPVVYGIPFYL
jgi:separase